MGVFTPIALQCRAVPRVIARCRMSPQRYASDMKLNEPYSLRYAYTTEYCLSSVAQIARSLSGCCFMRLTDLQFVCVFILFSLFY